MTVSSRRSLIANTLAVAAGSGLAARGARSLATPGNDALIPDEQRAMAALARDFTRKYGDPALSIAIARNDNLVYAEAFGMADKDREKLTIRHRFRIASVSKPITSVAVMGLIEQNRLALSDRVFGKNGVLGTAYGTQPYGPHIAEITVEHLLTHTAGGWDNEAPGPDPMFTNTTMNHAHLISWTLDNLPLKHSPGEHFSYSNFGYCVLGRIVEKITGVGYAGYVTDNVLKPCGISDMEIAGNTLADRRPLEVVYQGQKGENPYGIPVSRMDSHGGWIASAVDLVKFLVRVDGFPQKRDLLTLDTLRTMAAGSTVNPGYAKGWMVNRQGNWWHNGSLPGSTTLMVRTSGDLCWAALTNTRVPDSQMALDLDRLIWNVVGKVTVWPERDLF